MKETTFFIVLNIRTADGFEAFGKFFIGNSRPFASSLFQKLSGNSKVDEKTILSLELRELKNGLPVNMQMMSCTLQEIADNCRTITKETFKLFNLE